MGWKASRPVDLKAEFVRRRKAGERMTDLCREFGINRQTGYEVLARYESGGIEALLPQSRAPKRTRRTPKEFEQPIVEERKAHPTWGPKKLKVVLEQKYGAPFPSSSTIGEVLKRNGLMEPRKRRRTVVRFSNGLTDAIEPNHVWCTDYKGQFRLGDGNYCYPFTMTDQFTRFLLACDGMAAISAEGACAASVCAFRKHGLPLVIRSDNGAPFASRGLAALTQLSVFWIRLGIDLERIEPGEPQQNGRHERMHRTLKRETARPPSGNLLQQQQAFETFIEEFNNVRPHEALGQKPPSSLYQRSTRIYPEKLPELDYPLHDEVVEVGRNGCIRFGLSKVFIGDALMAQPLGLREEDDGRWLVTFARMDLGYIDPKTRSFEELRT